MYRESGVARCPACEGSLDVLHTELGVAGCNTCGGIWLGPDATMHIMQGLEGQAETEVAALSLGNARRSLHPPAPDSGARGCPSCGLVMSRVPVAQIVVDSCPTHGTFFDRDEVVDVVSACHKLRAESELRARTELGVIERILNGWPHQANRR